MTVARILVVDDEPDLESLIRQAFRGPIRDGTWDFTFVRDGRQALDHLDGGAEVDVVLSDIGMPVMDGLTLLSLLQGRPGLAVVIVSASSDLGNIREAMNRGAFDFVTKPMNLADLEVTITKAIEHVRGLRRLRQERDAAQDLARMKGEFIANVSHEIRTPMNAILGLAHLALADPAPDARTAYLRKIEGAARQLMSILNDILDMSRMDVGKLVLEQAPFHLQEVLTGTVELLEEQIAAKRLALSFDIGPRVPRRLVGDGRRLGQVLLNYLSNAVKFTAAGRITVAAALDAESPGECVLRLSVRDTGIGLQPEQRERVFQPFEVGDGSVTRRHGGTGLGLSIARNLAALMGGEVGVDSEPGRGSSFWFTARLAVSPADAADCLPEGLHRQRLPDGTAPSAAPAPAAGAPRRREATPAPDLRGLRILLVEDNELNVEVALGLLQRTGAVVDVADDGRQALERVAAGGCGLVLMDIQMPVMDGLEATRRIRADPAHRALPIIAMTASAMADEAKRCTEAGMNDLVVKPIVPAALYATLQRWWTGVPATPPSAAPSPAAAGAAWDVRSLSVPGLDVRAGLDALLGQQALYVRMLKRFVATQAGAASEIRSAYQTGDLKTAGRVAHTVKGICGTVGATALAGRAAALESALQESQPGPDVKHLIDRFEADLVRLCKAIEAAVPA